MVRVKLENTVEIGVLHAIDKSGAYGLGRFLEVRTLRVHDRTQCGEHGKEEYLSHVIPRKVSVIFFDALKCVMRQD